MVHQVVKAEKIAATAAVALEEQLIVPAVFRREGIDQYKGAENDTINVKVEGVLPYRSYGWRADRAQEVQFDEYTERTVAVQFGGDIYSAVKLTDEQNDMDLGGWAKLATKQTEAIGRGLEWGATKALIDAPYEITLKLDSANLKSSLIRARKVMNALRVPAGQRTILVGTDVEAALLEDEKLNLASNVGEAEAVSALREATLGRRYGFNFVVAAELDPDMAVGMVDSAFIFATGAPSVPQSVPFGATASHNGVAIRWIRDYDSTRFQDRSIFNTYKGFRHVEDVLVGRDAAGQAFVSQNTHFVRAIKLVLDGADVLPDPDGPDAKQKELFQITGIGGTADGPTV
ncbi:hypothetical protein [Micromonospora sp. CB01531]|uniref:hypothetical protein n=1 Tax=Micromonospora sp. CB01531 TaxID=1718947 RepID=UPI00093CF7ED|nr:hypothetical protein [Micromonospora sp. CB01531]OKI45107.1 hypothetical protein A6A27_11860 [Micromonospora sp. CB01531]